MKRVKLLNKIEKSGAIAVIRGNSKEQGKKACEALLRGGVKGLEVTFTLPEANQVIAELIAENNDDEVIIGAGTVLDVISARIAIMAGAEFIVSPTFDQATAGICNLYQIPYLPGCMTITEIKEAMKAGVDIVKLFPGSVYNSSIIATFKAPLPHVNIMPTGGVSLDNMEEWFKAGAITVGIGGNLLKPAEIGDYERITEMAKSYMKELKQIREGV